MNVLWPQQVMNHTIIRSQKAEKRGGRIYSCYRQVSHVAYSNQTTLTLVAAASTPPVSDCLQYIFAYCKQSETVYHTLGNFGSHKIWRNGLKWLGINLAILQFGDRDGKVWRHYARHERDVTVLTAQARDRSGSRTKTNETKSSVVAITL